MTATDTATEHAPLELHERVKALEERIARLGQDDDDTYPYLCAREFQLQDEQGELRGIMEVDSGGLARMEVYGGEPGKADVPHVASLAADEEGAMLTLMHRDSGVRLMAQLDPEDGSPRLKLYGPDREIGVEILVQPDAAAISVSDSQGRHRVLIGAGGAGEDVAELAVYDGEERGAVVFAVPAVSDDGKPCVTLDGWPQWFSSTVEKLWERVHVLEEQLGGEGGLSA